MYVIAGAEHEQVDCRFDCDYVDVSCLAHHAGTGEIKLKIVHPEPETDARFGWELTPVGSDGNILVAAPGSLVLGGSQGAAYLINAHDGDLLQTYRSPSGLPQDFGRAVAALNKNGVLIAGIDNLAAATGTLARFYHFNATTGSLVKTFAPPNGQEIVSFGQQIEVEGDGILVGASQSSAAGPNNSGAVYVLDAETGKQLQRFLPPSPITFGFFGDTIAFAGDNVVVGFGEAANKTAEACVFSAITGDLLHTFSPPDAGDDDLFGFRVAADGNNILVGAALDDTAGPDAGAAYCSTLPREIICNRSSIPRLRREISSVLLLRFEATRCWWLRTRMTRWLSTTGPSICSMRQRATCLTRF